MGLSHRCMHLMIEKIDRMKQAHAQKVVANPTSTQGKKVGDVQSVPFRYSRIVSALIKLTIILEISWIDISVVCVTVLVNV